MNFQDAEVYCRNHGGRLPTIRELADVAVESGARIRETATPELNVSGQPQTAEDAHNQSEEYMPVFTGDDRGRMFIAFYYNSSSYHAPHSFFSSEPTVDSDVWSSTMALRASRPGMPAEYLLMDPKGAISRATADSVIGIRCVE